MQKHLKTLFVSFLLVALIASCKDEESIQTYFVEHQELPNFTAIDLSPKMIDISKIELTRDQKETYSSLKRINFLGYRIVNNDLETYNKELKTVENIFKNDKYEAIMEFKTDGIKFKINTEGTNYVVDEILVLASTKDKGFGIVRVLGDNMRPENMVKLIDDLQKGDVDEKQLKGIIDFFK